MVGLIDTSVFISLETEPGDPDIWPEQVAVPMPTLAELEVGVLLAGTTELRHRRLTTLRFAGLFAPVPIDGEIPHIWAGLVSRLKADGRRAPINDVWIAATAIAHDMTVLTRDADYEGIPDVAVIRV